LLAVALAALVACDDEHLDTYGEEVARLGADDAVSARSGDANALVAAASVVVGLRPRGTGAVVDSVLWKLCDHSGGTDRPRWAYCSPRQVAARMPHPVEAAFTHALEVQCGAQVDACRGPDYHLDLAEPRIVGDSAFVVGSWRRVAGPTHPPHILGFELVLAGREGAWSYVRTAYLWES
jgi:hypothetical protein